MGGQWGRFRINSLHNVMYLVNTNMANKDYYIMVYSRNPDFLCEEITDQASLLSVWKA